MSSLNATRPADTLLEFLVEDSSLRIKNAQSSEYYDSRPQQCDSPQHQITEIYEYVRFMVARSPWAELIEGVAPSLYVRASNPDKVEYIRQVFKVLMGTEQPPPGEPIPCEECKSYEQYLQKLENDVRQHIRLEQQLKLYQEGLEEKLEDNKKEIAKASNYKQMLEEYRGREALLSQKIAQLEDQLEKVKIQTAKNSKASRNETSHRLVRESSQAKSFRALGQLKQNINTGVTKTASKKQCRRSCEKRPQSTERLRQTSYINSKVHLQNQTTQISQTHSKRNFLADRPMPDNEKRKNIQAKLQHRR